MAFGDLPERKVYTTILEAENREEKTSEFAFGSGEAIITDVENHTPLGSESVFLNGMVANRQLGLAKVLDINRGDRVALAVWAKYTQATGSGSGVGDLVSALLTAYGLFSTDAASGEALAQALGAGGEGAYVPVSNPEEAEDLPDAYLAYLFSRNFGSTGSIHYFSAIHKVRAHASYMDVGNNTGALNNVLQRSKL